MTRRVDLAIELRSADFSLDAQALAALAAALPPDLTVLARNGQRARVVRLEAERGRLVATLEDVVAADPLVSIRQSADGRFYYVVGDLWVRARTWLSTESFPGPLQPARLGAIPDAEWYEFVDPGGVFHHRCGFASTTSRIVMGDLAVIERDSDLYRDYASAARAAGGPL